VLFEGEVLGVIEFASVSAFSDLHLGFLERLVATIGIALNTIQANRRTEELLSQSQRLANELQEQSAELQRTNAELEEKATLLSEQNANIETKNREIEMARLGLEEKALELTQASQYKSEFLANMSHELRTPLNSLLLLARLLADNSEDNLTAKQIEFARTIYGAGSDLLSLIDDILDLSKIDSGRLELERIPFDLVTCVEEALGIVAPKAEEQGLALAALFAPDAPATPVGDPVRLRQILVNLLSNAVKFTQRGEVSVEVTVEPIDAVRCRLALRVRDTGIGVPADSIERIFAPFTQADTSAARRAGGLGIGLALVRHIALLHGGQVRADSAGIGRGATFTVTLPALKDAATAPQVPAPVATSV